LIQTKYSFLSYIDFKILHKYEFKNNQIKSNNLQTVTDVTFQSGVNIIQCVITKYMTEILNVIIKDGINRQECTGSILYHTYSLKDHFHIICFCQ